MERIYRSQKIGKIYNNTISNYEVNDINDRQPYYKNHNKTILITDNNRDRNDNLSEISSSVHTSYKYRKRKNGKMTISSRDFNHNYHNHYEDENNSCISMSSNENLICPDCINETLNEEKKLGYDLNKRNNIIDSYQYNNNSYSNYLTEEKRQRREKYTNYAMQTLSKLNSSISSKERLIQINENSSNPFQENNRDYQYEKFKREYEKRQKMINANIDKYFPENIKKSISETPLFFDKSEEKSKMNQKNKINKKEYLKEWEEQIKHKNEKKRKEKEEERKIEKKYIDDLEIKMKKEQEDKIIKDKIQKENFIKSNMDIINQKNNDKMKELNQKLKYKDYLDKKNELYKQELLQKQKENERLLNEIFNSNRKDNINNNKYNKIKDSDIKNNFKSHKYYLDEQKGECCRCHKILPRRMLTINRYFYKDNRNINFY